MRFHWIKSIESNDTETLRFTRAIFGLGESPFLLNGTIKEYFTTSKQRYPESAAYIEEIEESLYVDDLITGDATIEEVQKVKETAVRVFGEAKFKLRQWHSNVKELDDWNKVKDTFGVNFHVPHQPTTKKGILKFLASIYDPAGIISPVTLLAKDMYRDTCYLKLSWNQRLPEDENG